VDDSPSQTWIVLVLYATAAQNVTTSVVMKSLLTASDPGGVVTVGGTKVHDRFQESVYWAIR
jgi:hypothetical protein